MTNNPEELALKIRCHALRMTSSGKSSHIGSVLSIADILAVLYTRILNFDCAAPAIRHEIDSSCRKGMQVLVCMRRWQKSVFLAQSYYRIIIRMEQYFRDTFPIKACQELNYLQVRWAMD
jgi:hypothetical protein